jgi:hypothetical protein
MLLPKTLRSSKGSIDLGNLWRELNTIYRIAQSVVIEFGGQCGLVSANLDRMGISYHEAAPRSRQQGNLSTSIWGKSWTWKQPPGVMSDLRC